VLTDLSRSRRAGWHRGDRSVRAERELAAGRGVPELLLEEPAVDHERLGVGAVDGDDHIGWSAGPGAPGARGGCLSNAEHPHRE